MLQLGHANGPLPNYSFLHRILGVFIAKLWGHFKYPGQRIHGIAFKNDQYDFGDDDHKYLYDLWRLCGPNRRLRIAFDDRDL